MDLNIAPLIPTNPLVQFPDELVRSIIIIQNGWTAQIRTVERGADQVLQIYGWIGGFGVKPITGYISENGIVQNITAATNIKGMSAYQTWIAIGNTGTQIDFINSLTPPPVSTINPDSLSVKRSFNTLYNFIDQYTNELVTFTKSNDTVADGVIVIKRGAEYFRRNIKGGIIDVKIFGVKGDGSSNDTSAIQAAIDSTKNGQTLKFPDGTFIINQTLLVNKPIIISGSGSFTCQIIAVGCSGLKIDGVSNFQLSNISIAINVRYTQAVNAYIGIQVIGTPTNQSYNHIYRDVYVDGFENSFSASYIWSSLWDNFRAGFIHRGVVISGLSVNNVFTNGSLMVDTLAGSRGIVFVGDVPSEGWIINNNLINGCDIAIQGVRNSHIILNNNIIDHCRTIAIQILSSASDFASNWTIESNYIAMVGTVGDSAIFLGNNNSNVQLRGNRIKSNEILTYPGGLCNYGINMVGSQEKNNLIDGNMIQLFVQADIMALSRGNNSIVNNKCFSVNPALGSNIYGGDLIAGNTGSVHYERSTTYQSIGQLKITYDENIPINGSWNVGDICFRVNPVPSTNVGWACITAGSPGTWKAFGTLDS